MEVGQPRTDVWSLRTTLLITTSHRPTRRIRTLSHDLQRMLPDSIQINRGKFNFKGLVEDALLAGADRLLIIQRWKGGPGKMELYILKPKVQHYFPIIYLNSAILQDELQGHASVRKGLIAMVNEDASSESKLLSDALTTFLQVKRATIRQDLKGFPVSLTIYKADSGIVVTFKKIASGIEMGPRLVIKNLVWSTIRNSYG
ncbi:hypothetical protein MUP77_07390 [Candidatus Bathyarchaeota archaeon]|nr:hypothetical protein [Candidatus Bathyarchaeota archaeon]